MPRSRSITNDDLLFSPPPPKRDTAWLPPRCSGAISTSLSERGSWRGEIIHVTRDGRALHVKSSVTSVHYRHAAQRGIIDVVRDVTDCKANEAAHQQNVVLFSRLIEQAPMGTYVIDSAFRLQQMFWNLLNNAAKFTPTRGRIQIASAESDLNHVAPPACSPRKSRRHALPRFV